MARLDLLNARLRGRRDGALGRDGLLAVLAAPTLEARLKSLRKAGWWAAVEVEPGAPTLAAAERALRDQQRAEAAWLLEEVEGRRARALLTAWLGLAEADAVKVVLRGVAAAVPVDAILRSAPPAPGLPEPLLAAAAGSGSPEGALAALAAAGHPLSVSVAALLATPASAAPPGGARPAEPPPSAAASPGVAPRRARTLAALEAAVDAAAHQRVEAACAGSGEDAALLRGFLADRADARNAAALLTLAGGGGVVPFLPGGRRLDQAALDRLARLDAEPLAEALAEALPGLGPALATPWGAELGLLELELRAARRAARAQPLSLAVPVAHLLARRLEAARLAAVLRGAALGMAADDLLSIVEGA